MANKGEVLDKNSSAERAHKPSVSNEQAITSELGALPLKPAFQLGSSKAEPRALSPQQALFLQRKVGNKAVTQMLTRQRAMGAGRAPVQRKTGVPGVQREGEETETLLAGTATPEATKSESDTFDSVSSTKTKSETTTFSGGQATKKTSTLTEEMKKTSPKQIADTIEYMARVGAFGETAKEAAYERGGFTAKASGKASGSAGAQTNLKAGLEVSYDAFEMLTAFVEAGASVGVAGSIEGAASVALGPASIEVKAQLEAMAGAMVKATGKASIGLFKTAVAGSVEAFAGAKASAEGSVSFKIGDAAATATVKGEALAGASAAAKGEFSIGLSGVTLSAEAEAFAGVKASATGMTALTLKGVTILSAKGTVEVSAGVGGKAKGEFSFEMGKLKIGGALAGALGLGIGADVEIVIDFVALGDALQKLIIGAFYKKKEEVNRASPAAERVPLIDPELITKYQKLGVDTYYTDFEAYGQRLKRDGGPVTRQAVQSILDNRAAKIGDGFLFLETDKGIQLAISSTLFKAGLEDIEIQAGQIRRFQASGAEAFSAEKVKKLF